MATITLTGDLMTDGEIVYVNGMDLANVLRAAVPHRDDPKYQGRASYGPVTLRIEGIRDE